jgi:O-antigen/teichoic acid export membrane protein
MHGSDRRSISLGGRDGTVSAAKRHLGAGAALSVVVQGGPLLAGAVLSIILARTIGPSGNGRFALLATLTGITALVVGLGLTAGITYEVSRRRWSVRDAFRTSYLAALALGLIGSLGGLGIFVLMHDTVFGGIRTWVAVVALSSVPPVLAYQYADSLLLGREHYEGYAALELSHSGALLLVGAGLVIPFGLAGAVIGLPAAALVGATLGAVLLARQVRRDTVVNNSGSLGPALRFGFQSWGANLLQQINYRFDVLILGGFATARDVGVYSVALTLTGVAWVLPQALQTVLFPRAASLADGTLAGDVTADESDAALAKAVRHSVLLAFPAAVVVGVLLVIAVPLFYGGNFAETIPLGFVLLPGVLMLGVAKVMSSAIAGRGYPRYTLYIGAISAPLTLALYFWLISAFDEWGAAVASSISYAATALLALAFFRRVTRIGLRESLVPRSEDFADYAGLFRLARSWRPRREGP